MSPLLRVAVTAIAMLAYYVVTQLVIAASILVVLTLAGKSIPGYHEPARYTWWSWVLMALWIGGGVAVGWWAAVRLPRRLARQAG